MNLESWLQSAAILLTGLYAIFRLGLFIQCVRGDINRLNRDVAELKDDLDTIERRCIEQHREQRP